MESEQNFLVLTKNGRLYAIKRQSVLAGCLCVNGHNALQKFIAAMDLLPLTPQNFKNHEVSIPYKGHSMPSHLLFPLLISGFERNLAGLLTL